MKNQNQNENLTMDKITAINKIISTFVPFFARSSCVASFVGISVKRSETMMMVGKMI